MLKQRNSKKTYQGYIIAMIIAGMLGIYGCSDDNSATGPEEEEIEVAEVVIEPQNATFEVGEQQEFSAFLISATGDSVNEEVEVDWNWYSSDPDVFTVEAGGTATGHNPGEAFCIVEAELVAEKLKAKTKFVPIGLDSASVTLLN